MDLKYLCVATVVVIFYQVHMYQTDTKTANASKHKPVLHLNCTHNARIRLGGRIDFFSGNVHPRLSLSKAVASIVYRNCSFKHSCDIHVTRWHGFSYASMQYSCTRNNTFVRLKTEQSATRSKELNLYYHAPQDFQYIGKYTGCTIISDSNITAELVDIRGCPFLNIIYNINNDKPLHCKRFYTLRRTTYFKHNNPQLVHHFKICKRTTQRTGTIWLRFTGKSRITAKCTSDITTSPSTSSLATARPHTTNKGHHTTPITETTAVSIDSSSSTTQNITSSIVTVTSFQKYHTDNEVTQETTAVSIGSSSSTTQNITSSIVTVTSFQTYHTDNEVTQETTAVSIGSSSSTTQNITSSIVTVTSFQTYHTDNEVTKGSSQNQSSFPVGVVVGVAVAVVVFIVALVLVGYFVLCSRRRAESSTKSIKSTVLNGTYDASSTISVAGANLRTGKNILSLQDRLNESDNAIYSEPHDSTYARNEGEISINDDYNRIDFKTRKQFSVDPGYGTVAAHHGLNGGQDYSHICDVTPSQGDTYSHIPAGHALVTSGHEDTFDDTDDTYNYLNTGLGNRNHNARPCQDGIYSHIDESKTKFQPSCQDVDHTYWVLEKQ